MALLPYNVLQPQLRDKRRGRKHEANVSTSPELWAALNTYDGYINVTYLGNHVATLRPDNSLTINIGSYHSQTSCRIIEELSGRSASLFKNHIWTHGSPVQKGKLDYNCERNYITPDVCLKLCDDVRDRLVRVTLDNLLDKDRLRLELGVWEPTPAITSKILAYALGKGDVSTLGGRDVWTCIHNREAIVARCLETLT